METVMLTCAWLQLLCIFIYIFVTFAYFLFYLQTDFLAIQLALDWSLRDRFIFYDVKVHTCRYMY
jgi:hypothetical protein